jgi:hypothetical protein
MQTSRRHGLMQPCREAFISPPPHQRVDLSPAAAPARSVIPFPFQELPATHCTKLAQWLTTHLNQKLPHAVSGETALSASIPRSDPDDPGQQCPSRRRTRSRHGLLLLAGPTTPTALCTPGRPMDTHKRTSRTALNITRRHPKRSSLDALVCDSERTASRALNMHKLLRGNTSMPLPYIRRIAHPA